MANIKINNVSNLNTLVMELKSKVTISLTENVESIKATLSNINNYKNSGFSANVGDIANSLKNNLDNILSDITNASANYFNYASYINKFNVDDYNKSVNPVDLESQYNSIYLGKSEEQKEEKKNNSSGGSKSGSGEENLGDSVTTATGTGGVGGIISGENSNNIDPSKLESYLDTLQGTNITTEKNIDIATTGVDLGDGVNIDPNTLAIYQGAAYNQEQFVAFQNRYVINVPSNYGKVGDLIDISHSDGTVIKCIIGQIEPNNTGTVNFVVNQNEFTTNITELHPTWLQSVTSVKNKGNYFNYVKTGK